MSVLQLASVNQPENRPAGSRHVNESSAEDVKSSEQKPFNQQLNEEIEKTSAPSKTGDADAEKLALDKKPEEEVESENNELAEVMPLKESAEEQPGQLTGNLLPPLSQVVEQTAGTTVEDSGQSNLSVAKPASLKNILQDVKIQSPNDASMNKAAAEEFADSSDILDTVVEDTFTENAEKLSQKHSEQVKTVNENASAKSDNADFGRLLKTTTISQHHSLSANSATDTGKTLQAQVSQNMQIATPVLNKQWGHELTQRVSIMVAGGSQQSAELRLNPDHLGPLSVKLHIENDRANISFVTHHHSVKEAIEVSLPRLKDQLEQQGLGMGQVDVSSRENEHTGGRESSGEMASAFENSDAESIVNNETIIQLSIDDGVSIFV